MMHNSDVFSDVNRFFGCKGVFVDFMDDGGFPESIQFVSERIDRNHAVVRYWLGAK